MKVDRMFVNLRFAAAVACMLLLPVTAATAAVRAQDANSPLRVATHTIEPFVMQVDAADGSELTGFSVDLWDSVAGRLDVEYEWVMVDSVQEQLEAVEQGHADLAIAAITISQEREAVVDFSYPYFDAGLQIMTARSGSAPLASLLSVVSAFFSPVILQLIALLIVAVLIAAHAVWLVERNRNPDFHSNYVRGIWDGFWWAAVTVTTVGYGDKTAKGNKGRIVSLVWIFVGLFLITQFTAGVTATIAVQNMNQAQITKLNDLSRRRVVTVADTTSESFVRDLRLRPITVEHIDEAISMVETGAADAVVFDGPVLQYYAMNEGAGTVDVVETLFDRERYGIALPTNSPYRDSIDQALLAMMESGEYDTIYASWFGASPR